MLKINILFGIVLLFSITVNAQDDNILMPYATGYCEVRSLSEEYINKNLYACANATINQESTSIRFSLETVIEPVKIIHMTIEYFSPNGCFTFVPNNKKFKMCFNATTTSTQYIHPNDKQEILITRGIYYGDIKNFSDGINKKIWPETSPVPGYFQNDFQRTKVYYANQDDKINITYEIEEKPGYKLKLTVQNINDESNKWKNNNKNYIINEELIISGERSFVAFIAPKDILFRIYFYTFIKNDIFDPSPLHYSVKIIRNVTSVQNLSITEDFFFA